MRTKTLLLIAAFGAAGVATSMAQVYSVNAVGYVNKTIPKGGFAMVANPLDAGGTNNAVRALFKGVPDGFQVFFYDTTAGKYKTATFDDLSGDFIGDGAGQIVLPGQGVFAKNPTTSDVTVTFVG